MWGLLSIILVWQGFKHGRPKLMIAAGMFAIASALSWLF